MLAPLFIESHAFLIQQDRLQDAERLRRAPDLAPGRAARLTLASCLRGLAHCLTTSALMAHIFAGDHA